MKRILLGILGVCACHAYAQTFKEWQDPEINAVNRAPMHTDFFAYESTELAAKGMKELSGNFMEIQLGGTCGRTSGRLLEDGFQRQRLGGFSGSGRVGTERL